MILTEKKKRKKKGVWELGFKVKHVIRGKILKYLRPQLTFCALLISAFLLAGSIHRPHLCV